MRAIAISATDGPAAAAALHELLRPEPATGPGADRARGFLLNHADLWASHGQPRIERRFPFVLGVDGAGTIDAVGTGVDDPCIGSDVVVNPVLSCGHCGQCVAGERMLCRTSR